MPRSTPSRVILGVVAVATIVGLAALARSAVAEPAADERTFAGVYDSDTDFRVANLTIGGGHVRVGYSVDVLYLPQGPASTMRCGLVDTSGRLDFFEGSRTTAASGQWMTLAYESAYELPELTLGIRCSPNSSGALSVVFRDPVISVAGID